MRAFHEFANGGNAKGVKAQGNSQEVFVIFRAVVGPPGGREWAQNVAPGASFRTPKYRPNPANGDPLGGKIPFWKNPFAPLTLPPFESPWLFGAQVCLAAASASATSTHALPFIFVVLHCNVACRGLVLTSNYAHMRRLCSIPFLAHVTHDCHGRFCAF